MASDNRQLQHLWLASHTLTKSSPQISAHLMSRYLELAVVGKPRPASSPATATRNPACMACGTIRETIRKSSPNVEIQKDKNEGTKKKRKYEKFTCPACQSVTIDDVPAPCESSPAVGKKTAEQKTKDSTTASGVIKTLSSAEKKADIPPSSSAGNPARPSNSRKRRKGFSSLSNMLAKERQSGTGGGGFGLDLSDLMKTG